MKVKHSLLLRCINQTLTCNIICALIQLFSKEAEIQVIQLRQTIRHPRRHQKDQEGNIFKDTTPTIIEVHQGEQFFRCKMTLDIFEMQVRLKFQQPNQRFHEHAGKCVFFFLNMQSKESRKKKKVCKEQMISVMSQKKKQTQRFEASQVLRCVINGFLLTIRLLKRCNQIVQGGRQTPYLRHLLFNGSKQALSLQKQTIASGHLTKLTRVKVANKQGPFRIRHQLHHLT